MTSDEQKLIARIRSGDPRGFATLYTEYGSRVMGFLLRLTGNRAEAEDILQEVFMAAYTGRTGFQGRSRLVSWLLGIAARRWRDRKRYSTPELLSLEATAEAEDSSSVVGRRDTLEVGVVNTMTLNRALHRLDAPLREALLLVRSQGLSYKEAAEILGEPIGTVKWRVSEATHRLHDMLDRIEEEFDEMQQTDARPDRVPFSR